MAILTNEQAIELIKQPKNQTELAKAKAKKLRGKLHTEAETDTTSASESLQRFFNWVSGVLKNTENYNRFVQLCKPPLISTKLVGRIFTEYKKIFEAQNSFEKFQFTTPELEQDFTRYREEIGDFQFWDTQGFEAFRNSIDNMIVVDMPELSEPASGLPTPYYYLLDINNIHDVDNVRRKGVNGDGTRFYFFRTEYLISKGGDDLFYVFDDASYRVYKYTDGNVFLVREVPHTLGYCPARSFWTTPLNSDTVIRKMNPITESISDLDWYLFLSIAERYVQLYGSFPIYVIYKPKCNYTLKKAGSSAQCVEGWLQWNDGRTFIKGEGGTACPNCSSKMQVGPGNVIMVDPPRDKDDSNLMDSPVKIIAPDVTSLEYVRDTVRELKKDIYADSVGRKNDAGTDQAKNELDITSGFESSESMLLWARRNFDIAQQFALDTIARLRYGAAYTGGIINGGDKFFIKDEARAEEEYKSAVENQLPEYELAMRREDMNNARYKNDPVRHEKIRIMENLLPYPDVSLTALSNLKKDNPDLVSERDFILKLNFNNYIQRFEREQTNLNVFGRALSFDKKIEQIKTELYSYVDEYIASQDPEPEPMPEPVPPAPVPVPPVPEPAE